MSDLPVGLARRETLTRTVLVAAVLAASAAGCDRPRQGPDRDRTAQADALARQRWGKGLRDLPTVTLTVISPHNENIQREFEWAFSLHHAVAHGQNVHIEWRDVGGGTSSILQYLRNVYGRSASAGIDVLWGGGDFVFKPLAAEGILEPMTLTPDALANIPVELGGIRLYDPEHRWCGSALSGFGFLYNAGMLRRCGVVPPTSWDDLADGRFADLLALADPTESGSAATSYLMIVQSGADWPAGWAKLLGVLGNAKRFTDSAGSAANAPVLGEALVATCIDFYGVIRVAEAPEELAYLSPPGQTLYNPDPIAILANPPHRALAQRFVDFVLSARGQALWALPPGHPDGPARSILGRQPIRRDVYQTYAGQMLPRVVDVYRAGEPLAPNEDMERAGLYGVLKVLVRTAAVENCDLLRAARRRLNALRDDPARRAEYETLRAEFFRLPPDAADLPAIADTGKRLKDPVQAELVLTAWHRFFRDKYERIVE